MSWLTDVDLTVFKNELELNEFHVNVVTDGDFRAEAHSGLFDSSQITLE